jgi:hypothetical protein
MPSSTFLATVLRSSAKVPSIGLKRGSSDGVLFQSPATMDVVPWGQRAEEGLHETQPRAMEARSARLKLHLEVQIRDFKGHEAQGARKNELGDPSGDRGDQLEVPVEDGPVGGRKIRGNDEDEATAPACSCEASKDQMPHEPVPEALEVMG